ncbi:MAG: zf-TFIIB domain-containing protein [Ignavibacteriales bacterium]|nr:zf-TFIIB domain-containing protein [Ignavibacteriales bacterium]
MIQIKPEVKHFIKCPKCDAKLPSEKIIFQGIHIVAKHKCKKCGKIYYSDLPVGHAIDYSYIIDLEDKHIWGSDTSAKNWFGKPLLKSFLEPNNDDVELNIKVNKKTNSVVILNCLDYLYGHSLLKLLNTERLINDRKDVVVIVPIFLEWMIPKGTAEVWVVNQNLGKSLNYYPDLDKKIKKQLKRFKTVYIDKAFSHPSIFDIKKFTGIEKHNLFKKNFRVSFIWREDRPWFFNDYIVYGLKRIKALKPIVFLQYLKAILLFRLLKYKLPDAKYTVVGKGKSFSFPKWIDDQRVDRFNPKIEKKLCRIYSESRVVVGVHGSNILLPSAHAGMVVDLLPVMRMGNFAQDVLYQEEKIDPRMISFKYRYFPISIGVFNVAKNIQSMIMDYKKSLKNYQKTNGY